MLRELLLRPTQTIKTSLADETDSRRIGIWWLGFAFLSFNGAVDGLSERTESSTVTLLLIAAAGALTIGAFLWAYLYGGLLHLLARLFGGKVGFRATIQSLGLALFWPGLVASVGAMMYLAAQIGPVPYPIAFLGLSAQILAGFWALYSMVLALRVRHDFGWGRAIVIYLLPVFLLALGLLIFVI